MLEKNDLPTPAWAAYDYLVLSQKEIAKNKGLTGEEREICITQGVTDMMLDAGYSQHEIDGEARSILARMNRTADKVSEIFNINNS
tara:strand:+ start:18 stop:275 length:258 start_codon:yes stop_codon:yes gene_type:complete